MNQRILAASLALVMTPMLPADDLALEGSDLFGLTPDTEAAPVAAPVLPEVAALGLPALGPADFPAFGGFRATTRAGQRVVAMPGMVARTHLHILARRLGQEGTIAGTPIGTDRPLGAFGEPQEEGMLRAVMVKDSARVAMVSERPAASSLLGDGDFMDVFQRRLESLIGQKGAAAGRTRELGFTLTSSMGDRRRFLLVYAATPQVEDGTEWWVADFYDPHVQDVTAGSHRLSQLRLRLDDAGQLVAQVRAEWATRTDEASEVYDPFSTEVVGEWATLGAGQLHLLDDPAGGWTLDGFWPTKTWDGDYVPPGKSLWRVYRPDDEAAARQAAAVERLMANLEEGIFDGVAPGGALD